MAAEKDASEAIRSVVATLPNIHKLKPEQEEVWLIFVGGPHPHGVREQFDFPATAVSSLTVVVKECD